MCENRWGVATCYPGTCFRCDSVRYEDRKALAYVRLRMERLERLLTDSSAIDRAKIANALAYLRKEFLS